MGKLVDASSLPTVARTGQYDKEIDEARSMPPDKAMQIDIPTNTKPESANLAIRDRIKKLGRADELHVRKIDKAVYILHGPSPFKAKPKTKRSK